MHTHTHLFYGPFPGTTWVSQCQNKKSSEIFMVQGKITEADAPTIWLAPLHPD